jgi:hypothetical protein
VRYQWQFKRKAISRETNSVLVISNVAPSNAGNYRVRVFDAQNSIFSAVAGLTVLMPPAITAEPGNVAVAYQGRVNLSVTASGTPPLRYQWLQNGSPLTSGTNRVLNLVATNLAVLGTYRVIVSNPYGIVTSRVAQASLRTNTVEFTSDSMTVSELTGAISIPVRRTGSTNSFVLPVLVGGDAVRDRDFRQGTQATIPANVEEGAISLRILDDPDVDGPRTVPLELSTNGAPDLLLGTNRLIRISIQDNDTPTAPGFGFDADIRAILPLPDGGLVLGGKFETVSGRPWRRLVRLLPDLSVDEAFDPPSPIREGAGVDELVGYSLGRILARGAFLTDDGRSPQLRRFFLNGSEDLTMAPFEAGPGAFSFSAIRQVVADGGDRTLIAGRIRLFHIVNPGGGYVDFSGRNPPLARLLPDGTRDPVFSANLLQLDIRARANAVAELPDGSIVAVGIFANTSNATNRNRVLRLRSDGSPDPQFRSGTGFNNTANTVVADERARLLITGPFGAYDSVPVRGWVRLQPDGSLDPTFAPDLPGTNIVQQVLAPDGSIVVRTSEGSVLRFSENGTHLQTLATDATSVAIDFRGGVWMGTDSEPRLMHADLVPRPAAVIVAQHATIWSRESTLTLSVPILRYGDATGSIEVPYRLVPGAGTGPEELPEPEGSVIFNAGQARALIELPLAVQNTVPNDDRTFTVQLLSTQGNAVAPERSRVVVTVEDDDAGLTSEAFTYPTLVLRPLDFVSIEGSQFAQRVATRVDPTVFAEWVWDAPPSITNDWFSVIWTAELVPEESGLYRFRTLSDDGVRLWLDGQLLFAHWQPSIVYNTSEPIDLKAGERYRLVLNYNEYSGAAFCHLSWFPPGHSNAVPIPRRVFRPALPLLTRPQIEFEPVSNSGQGIGIRYMGEPGRPLRIESSTDGSAWRLVAEVVSTGAGRWNSFFARPARMPTGGLVRAVSLDGIIVTNAARIPWAIGIRQTPDPAIAGTTNDVVLSVESNGTSDGQIVWLRDGIRTGEGEELRLSPQDIHQPSEYLVIVTSPLGVIASAPFVPRVLHSPAILSPLADADAFAGELYTLDSGAEGTEPLGFQWYKDGTAIADAVGRSLTIAPVTAQDEGSYSVIITNSVGSATNGFSLLRVHTPVRFAGPPTATLIGVDGETPLNLNASVEGTGELSYQWRLNGNDLPRETNASVLVEFPTRQDWGSYSVVVANGVSTTISTPVEVVPPLPQLPGNDGWSHATLLPSNSGLIAGNNAKASREQGEPGHAGKQGGRSVWYQWSSPQAGVLSIDTQGSSFDSLLAVYTGDHLATLQEITSSDDLYGEEHFSSAVTFTAGAGKSYWVAVDSFGDAGGNYVLNWSFQSGDQPVPRFTRHPVSSTQVPGGEVILSVTVEHAETVTWWKDEFAVAGASGPDLVLPRLGASGTGTYRAMAIGAGRTVWSEPAVVAMSSAVGIVPLDKPGDYHGAGATQQPVTGSRSATQPTAPALVLSPGLSASFVVNNASFTTQAGEANHCGVITHRTGWVPLVSTADGTLQISIRESDVQVVTSIYDDSDRQVARSCAAGGNPISAVLSAGEAYWLVLGSQIDDGGVISFDIVFGTPPQPPSQPVMDAVMASGASAVLRAPATGNASPPPHYQWVLDGRPIPGATGSELLLTGSSAEAEGEYSVRINNPLGEVEYLVARLHIEFPTAIDPESVVLIEGGLRLEVTGNPGQKLILERSQDLTTWVDVIELMLPIDGVYRHDARVPGAMPAAAFYRTRELPLAAIREGSLTDGTSSWLIVGGRVGQEFEIEESTDRTNWVPLKSGRVGPTPYKFLTRSNGAIRARPVNLPIRLP